jgi:hypothetical protein
LLTSLHVVGTLARLQAITAIGTGVGAVIAIILPKKEPL